MPPVEGVTFDVYLRAIVPIGALFSIVLWLGNTAYLYLSVSFIQMLKARLERNPCLEPCQLLPTAKPCRHPEPRRTSHRSMLGFRIYAP